MRTRKTTWGNRDKRGPNITDEEDDGKMESKAKAKSNRRRRRPVTVSEDSTLRALLLLLTLSVIWPPRISSRKPRTINPGRRPLKKRQGSGSSADKKNKEVTQKPKAKPSPPPLVQFPPVSTERISAHRVAPFSSIISVRMGDPRSLEDMRKNYYVIWNYFSTRSSGPCRLTLPSFEGGDVQDNRHPILPID